MKAPLEGKVSSVLDGKADLKEWMVSMASSAYISPAVRKMIELISPTIHSSLPAPVRLNS